MNTRIVVCPLGLFGSPGTQTGAELVAQFDAHLDVYNLSDSKRELNHGNYLRHAAKLPAIVNVGHRDLFLPDKEIDRFFQLASPAAASGRAPESVAGTLKAMAKRP